MRITQKSHIRLEMYLDCTKASKIYSKLVCDMKITHFKTAKNENLSCLILEYNSKPTKKVPKLI